MQKLNPATHGFLKTESSLRFLHIRLRSRPISQPMAEEIREARARLRQQHDLFQEAFEERVAATAEIFYRDSIVNNAVMKLSRSVLLVAEGDRTAPSFVVYSQRRRPQWLPQRVDRSRSKASGRSCPRSEMTINTQISPHRPTP